jgi:hypothetical protein
MFGTSALCLVTYSEHETLCQGTANSVTYGDDNFACSNNSLVGYYFRSDNLEKSTVTISRAPGRLTWVPVDAEVPGIMIMC